MNKNAKIYIAGHNGLVGSGILRALKARGLNNIIKRSSREMDLSDLSQVREFFLQEKPEYVFLAAAKVGGIWANNQYPADFIYDNLAIQMNVIHQSYVHKVKKLMFLGSSCIYPKFAPQPMSEDCLLSGKLEPTNEPYAVAKIAGIKMCQSYNRQYQTRFISLMPTNLYGQNDNFDLETAHVLPSLIRKFHEAKVNNKPFVEIWGSGNPYREFLHVDDLAEACIYLMEHYHGNQIVNIGVGKEISIKELALLIKKIVGFKGELKFNPDKPDGAPRKLLDVTRLRKLGWEAKISLAEGIQKTYQWYVQNKNKAN